MDIALALLIAAFVVLVAFAVFWKLYFLRLPERNIPKKGIVSPANGKLVRIIAYKNGRAQNVAKGLLGVVRTLTADVAAEGYILVIMLTPLHVHYQRAPADGRVQRVTYTKGAFRNAVLGAGELRTFENEKNEILLSVGKGRMKIVQVAGIAARRISCFVSPGQKVAKGEIIGLINFGSQTLLILPKRKLLVKEGQELIDGETVIA